MAFSPGMKFCIGLALAASSAAAMAWDFRYEGPDEITLITRPNAAGTNTRGAALHVRELPSGRLEEALRTIVTSALESCSQQDITRVTVKPFSTPDRFGDTITRIQGPGIYLNLPDADRVNYGNWYIAPFFALTVSLKTSAGATDESIDLFEFTRINVDARVPTTQGAFLETRTADLFPSVVAFASSRLPAALRQGLSRHCSR